MCRRISAWYSTELLRASKFAKSGGTSNMGQQRSSSLPKALQAHSFVTPYAAPTTVGIQQRHSGCSWGVLQASLSGGSAWRPAQSACGSSAAGDCRKLLRARRSSKWTAARGRTKAAASMASPRPKHRRGGLIASGSAQTAGSDTAADASSRAA